MMKQSSHTQSYYKAYYLAKAWIELGLTQIDSRGVWFEYVVHTWDAIVLDNFYSGAQYTLASSISGTALQLSKKFWQLNESGDCVSPYDLAPGDAIVVPLFRDSTAWSVVDTLTAPSTYQNLAHIFKENQIEIVSEFDWEAVFGILILSGQELSENGIFFQKWNFNSGLPTFRAAFETYLSGIDVGLYPVESQWENNYDKPWMVEHGFTLYLLISNASDEAQRFCIDVLQSQQIPEAFVLPTDTFIIKSQASYLDQQVVLDASYAQPIPGFLFNTYSNY